MRGETLTQLLREETTKSSPRRKGSDLKRTTNGTDPQTSLSEAITHEKLEGEKGTHRTLRYASVCWNLLRILGRGRVLVLLALVFVLLGPAIVVVRHLTGSITQDPPLYLRYAPDVTVLAEHSQFLDWKQFPMLVPPEVSAFFHVGELITGSSLSLNGLNEIYRVLVALLMMLIGANVLPQTRELYGTLFTLPARKGTLFLLHAGTLAVVCILLFGVAFVLNAAAVILTKGYDPDIFGLVFNIHVLLLLYGGFFASLGLAFAALFRRRGVALLAGVVAIILVISILPNFRNAMYFSYITEHAHEMRLAKRGGYLPDDPVYRTIRALTLTPGTSYTRSMALMGYDVRFPESPFCPDPECSPGETRWQYLNRVRIALVAMSLGLMALGAAAFSRKEVS